MMAISVSFIALGIAFFALLFSIVSMGRARDIVRAEFGDPTSYCVVTNGKFYRVRGPFDTFYTIRFHDRDDAQRYADQLAAWHRHLSKDELNWKEAA